MKAYLATEPAFPVIAKDGNATIMEPGMSLRDYFAAAALQGFIANSAIDCDDAARFSYAYADAMLKERAK